MEQLRAAPSVQGPSHHARGSGGAGGVSALISGLVPSPASAAASGPHMKGTGGPGGAAVAMRSGGSSGNDDGGGGAGGFSSDTPGQSVGAEVRTSCLSFSFSSLFFTGTSITSYSDLCLFFA